MEEFTRLVVNTGGPAVTNGNTTAMKTEEMTIIRLFSHALRQNTMVATTTSTRVRLRPSREGSKRSSIIRKTLMQSRSTPASTRYTRGSDNCTSWHCVTGRRCVGTATCWTSWTAGPTIRLYEGRRPRRRSSGLVEEYDPVVWAKTAVHNIVIISPHIQCRT
jgi:hypothetical protein